MAVERQKKKVFLLCDGCMSEQTEPVEDTQDAFREMVEQAKQDGWLIYKDETVGGWVHYCRDCR